MTEAQGTGPGRLATRPAHVPLLSAWGPGPEVGLRVVPEPVDHEDRRGRAASSHTANCSPKRSVEKSGRTRPGSACGPSERHDGSCCPARFPLGHDSSSVQRLALSPGPGGHQVAVAVARPPAALSQSFCPVPLILLYDGRSTGAVTLAVQMRHRGAGHRGR